MSPIDPNIVDTAQEFRRGGWIVTVLGGLGAIARLLVSEDKFKPIVYICKGIAGCIVGTMVYFAINSAPMDGMYKSMIYAFSGALAPDIFEWAKRKVIKE